MFSYLIFLLIVSPKIEEMSRVYLRSQQSINITCSSMAVPPATYKWMRKGGVFGSNVIEHKDGVLEIKRLVGTLETYTCTATNLAGSDTADVEVQLVQSMYKELIFSKLL